MNSGDFISVAELTAEIWNENRLSPNSKDDFARQVRAKYVFLCNHVVMRSKMTFKANGKDRIPLRDKSIVKVFLTHAMPSCTKEGDDIIVDWFNNRIKEDDFVKIIELGRRVEELIEDAYYADRDMDQVTRDEWLSAIHSAIKLDYVQNLVHAMDALRSLNLQLLVLNHGIPFNEMIRENRFGSRVYLRRSQIPYLDMSKPLEESLNNCCSMDDYSRLLFEFLSVMECDVRKKTIDFIKAYAELKIITGATFADELLPKNTLASEYIAFFQNIYDFLSGEPKVTKEIEQEIGTTDLLDFFKMKDRNNAPDKKAK